MFTGVGLFGKKVLVLNVILELPAEFGLHKFIDYDTQFEKTFLDPLKDILNCVGWDYEKRYTIDNFFV